MTCADLDHLVFLMAGDAALSRRARKASRLVAVVVRLSRSRKRFERQGILVEEAALQQAETQCLADEDERARRCQRDRQRHADQDGAFEGQLAEAVARLSPGCPPERTAAIVRFAAVRGSGQAWERSMR
jgi:DNA-binding helix-hairpin-helix protein with protein kinase domain